MKTFAPEPAAQSLATFEPEASWRRRTLCSRATFPFVALFMTLCLPSFSANAESTLVITGVEGELEQNIRLLVANPPDQQDERKFKRYINALPDQVVSALSAYGYYAADVTVSVDEVARAAPKRGAREIASSLSNTLTGQTNSPTEPLSPTVTQLTVNVTRNAPVTIGNVTVQVADINSSNTDFDSVLAQIRTQLAPGKVFISSEYESAKSSLLNVAQNLGYFDLDFSETRVAVSRKAGTANIKLTALAGERYTFGDTLFQQVEFSDAFMTRWTPIEQGDLYKSELIGELTQNLQNSGYFSSVRVRPLVDPRYGTTVPIAVDLTLKERNQVAIGIGFSTDTKLRTKLSWDKPLLNSYGHSANGGFSLAAEIQSASFAYRIPRDKQPLYNYWGIEYGVKNDVSGDTDSFLGTLNFQRVTRTPRGWTESLFLRWEREVFEVSDVEAETDLILPGFSYSRVRSEGKPFPTKGQSLSFELMGGSRDVLSTINFVKVAGRLRYLRALSERNTFIGTAQYGAIHASDNDLIPVSQRFFAGGDRTIRGFAFRTVSPVDEDGDEIGGRFLEVLNLEYNYRFADLWSGALFVDGGRAFNTFDTGYSVGSGFGVRWQSPVGPFRIDIATPVKGGESGDIRIHLSLGADL